ncbi:unnamed protein product [Acidithrix sp. C25]|nr:unnamed protein product [Acidithrix sp. C25]
MGSKSGPKNTCGGTPPPLSWRKRPTSVHAIRIKEPPVQTPVVLVDGLGVAPELSKEW